MKCELITRAFKGETPIFAKFVFKSSFERWNYNSISSGSLSCNSYCDSSNLPLGFP